MNTPTSRQIYKYLMGGWREKQRVMKAEEKELVDKIMKEHIFDFLSFGAAQEWFNVKFRNAMTEYAEIKSKERSTGFAEWISRGDSPFAIMYGDQKERFADMDKEYTTEQLYEMYLLTLK